MLIVLKTWHHVLVLLFWPPRYLNFLILIKKLNLLLFVIFTFLHLWGTYPRRRLLKIGLHFSASCTKILFNYKFKSIGHGVGELVAYPPIDPEVGGSNLGAY
jgi:hypothetical protein